MRRFLLGFFCLSAMLTLTLSGSWAVGNVLLPKTEENQADSGFNLGLVPQKREPAVPPASVESQKKSLLLPPPSEEGDCGDCSASGLEGENEDCPEEEGASGGDQADEGEDIPLPVVEAPGLKDNRPTHSGGRRIFYIEDQSKKDWTEGLPAEDLAEILKETPHVLTVSFSKESLWSPSDFEKISSDLGLSSAEIPTACLLSMRGVLKTDKGAYSFEGGLSSTGRVSYAGVPADLSLKAQALCLVRKELPTSGYSSIVKIDDRFLTPLGSLDCTPPAKVVSGLDVAYKDGKAANCVYR